MCNSNLLANVGLGFDFISDNLQPRPKTKQILYILADCHECSKVYCGDNNAVHTLSWFVLY